MGNRWANGEGLDAVADRLRALRHGAEDRGDYQQADALPGALRAHLDVVRREGSAPVIDLDDERDKRKR